jgi:hypothetical protein
MTNIHSPRPQQYADPFGRKVAARLSQGAGELPYEISERLRAARVQALAHRKLEAQARPARAVFGLGGGTAALSFKDDRVSLWNRVASAIPLLVLAFGLVVIHTAQTERRAADLAEVDVALLTDDLPPAAYADPGFAQFLRTGGQ